jgi:hypothetical protein
MYAPLAPYIDPALDTYENLKTRSPLLLNCIVCVFLFFLPFFIPFNSTPFGPAPPHSSVFPCLTTVSSHLCSAVASRLSENRELVDSQRARTLNLIRETLYPERTLTLDDVRTMQLSQHEESKVLTALLLYPFLDLFLCAPPMTAQGGDLLQRLACTPFLALSFSHIC